MRQCSLFTRLLCTGAVGLLGFTAFGGDQTLDAKSPAAPQSVNPIGTSASAAGANQVTKTPAQAKRPPAVVKVKPDSPTPAATLGGGSGPAPRGTNDNCADAIQINCGDTISGDTTGNTTDGIWPCAAGGNESWYSIVAGDPVLTLSLCGSGYDTAVMVLDTCGGTVLGCNDDFCGLQSQLSVGGLTVGNTYLIAVGGFASNTGPFTMVVTCGIPACDGSDAQPGDIEENEGGDCGIDNFNGGCNSAPPVYSPIACGQSVHGTSGTNDAIGYRDTDWWLFTVDAPGAIVTWTVTANFPPLIGFVSGACPAPGFLGTPVTGAACTEISAVSTCLPPGQYVAFVAPSGFAGIPCGSEYRGTLSCVTCEPPPPPANDDCNNAIQINCGDTVFGDNTGATNDGLQPSCSFGGAPTNSDLWYSFVAADTVADVSLCGGGSITDTNVAVYDGCGGSEIACNDDFCGLLSQTSANGLTVGNTYYIRVSGWNATPQGTFTLNVTCRGPCALAQPGDIEENEGGDCGVDNFNGGCNSNPPVFSPIACGQSVHGTSGTNDAIGYRDTDWWLFTVDAPGAIVTWTVTADFPVLIGFTGQPCPQPGFLPGTAITAPACTEVSSVTQCLLPGQYVAFVAPSVFSGVSCGTPYRGTLSCVTCEPPPPPPNNNCADAIQINCGDTINGDTTNSSTDAGWICAAGGNDIWYSFVAGDPVATLSLCGSGYDTAVTVLDGCGGAVLGCNDDFCGLQSQLSVGGLTVGNTYLIAVGGFAGNVGPFTMTLTCGLPTCDGSEAQPGDIEENEGGDCGIDNFNGGCNSNPPVFSPIACGQSVHGTSGTNDAIGYRDTDWWLFTVTEANTIVTLDAIGNFPTLIGFVGQPCPQPGFLAFATANACTPVSVTMTLQPGQYVAFVAPSVFAGVPCGSEYRATLTCVTNGACCVNGDCSITTPANCAAQGGSYQGDGTNCGGGNYSEQSCSDALEDISSTGTASVAGNCDDCGETVSIGFNFPFFGNTYSSIGIASNGYLSFGGVLTDFSNDAIPNTLTPNDLIAPYWDDFNTLTAGDVYYQSLSSPTRFVVMWSHVARFDGGGSGDNTFEAILYPDGTIDFRYGSIDGPPVASPSVGVENIDGTVGLALDVNTIGNGNTCRSIAFESTGNPCEQTCVGDLDGDGDRDIADLAILLSQFGSTGGSFAGDIDGDGDVDIGDLATLLSVFGVPC